MTKILYMLTENFLESPIYEAAKDLNVEVIPERISRDSTEEEIRNHVRRWEGMGVDVILCRGNWENRIKPYVERAFAMGLQFSYETTLGILCGYKKKYPDFFGEKEKRVLLISSQKLYHNAEVLSDLFCVKLVNVCWPDLESDHKLIEQAKKYDLVICGNRYKEFLEQHGINAYFQVLPEIHTLHSSFMLADVLANSRKTLQEKNAEIQNILDNGFSAVVSLDTDGVIRQGNQRLKKYFKLEKDEIIGKRLSELIPGFNETVIQEGLKRQSGIYGELVEFDNRILVMNSMPFYSAGKVNGAVVHFEELKQIERVEDKIKAELYNKGLIAKYHFDDIMGQSAKMIQAKNYAKDFAKHNSNVLLYGESGTGKELFAQSIHNYSSRKNGPFVAVNCGALPNNLLESELFGYVSGAFTGASKNGKKGLLELANKGTIFLDEISEMDLLGQVRLLRVLEERVITRVGDDRVLPVDVRIVAASNKNLKELVEVGKFREDLYYRLNVLMLKIPPLRERKQDIVLLTEEFLHHFGEINKKQIELTEEAMKRIEQYKWKGNVRQLRNFCERLVIIANKRVVGERFVIIQLNDSFFEFLPETNEINSEENQNSDSEEKTFHIGNLENEREKEAVLKALNAAQGKREKAAELLGISKTSLWRKMKKHQIEERY